MAEILKGAPVAAHIREEIIKKVEFCKAHGSEPRIAVVRVGERPDDIAYEKRVIANCAKVNLAAETYCFPEKIAQEDIETELERLNRDDSIHGILLFRPLPAELNEARICELINPAKDIDCMNPENLSKTFGGTGGGFSPCTPEAVIEILKYYNVPLKGAKAVIVNRSMVLGKPLAMLLLGENATVTICHSKTAELKEATRGADIIVTGIGRAEFFTEEYFSSESVVIDVGINFADGRMTGDVEQISVEQKVKAMTPVPGGVGTVTSMILLRHAADAAWRIANNE